MQKIIETRTCDQCQKQESKDITGYVGSSPFYEWYDRGQITNGVANKIDDEPWDFCSSKCACNYAEKVMKEMK